MIAAALLIVTVVGCMVGPDYTPPAMKLPAHWDGNDQQIKQVENQDDKTDLATWWQAFDDPLLNSVIAEALSSNLDEKIALSRDSRRARLRRDEPRRAFPQRRYVRLVHSPAVQRQHSLRILSAGYFQEMRTSMKPGSTRAGSWMSSAVSGAASKPRRPSWPHRSRTRATYG